MGGVGLCVLGHITCVPSLSRDTHTRSALAVEGESGEAMSAETPRRPWFHEEAGGPLPLPPEESGPACTLSLRWPCSQTRHVGSPSF